MRCLLVARHYSRRLGRSSEQNSQDSLAASSGHSSVRRQTMNTIASASDNCKGENRPNKDRKQFFWGVGDGGGEREVTLKSYYNYSRAA